MSLIMNSFLRRVGVVTDAMLPMSLLLQNTLVHIAGM